MIEVLLLFWLYAVSNVHLMTTQMDFPRYSIFKYQTSICMTFLRSEYLDGYLRVECQTSTSQMDIKYLNLSHPLTTSLNDIQYSNAIHQFVSS